MITIEKKNVTGSDALKYIRDQLDIGGSLANYINTLPIEIGEVYSFVPKDTTNENLYNFSSGGIYPFDKRLLKSKNILPVRNNAKFSMVDEIQNYLKISDTNCCLFEDTVNIPSDSWIKASGIEYIYIKDKEMFYYFDKLNNSAEKINEALTKSENYSFTCGLSSLSKNDHKKFATFEEINMELIMLFVKSISLFFVRAYDGEGYLMWVKSPFPNANM
jgi:hypothetical protein